MTRGKGVRPFGEHVDDLIPVYFAEITSVKFWPSPLEWKDSEPPKLHDPTPTLADPLIDEFDVSITDRICGGPGE